ncbi:TonB-dependent receptor domain-containing protein [Sphingomonas colocasiae]|uniref:TonB-dependent receptor n=1 Tax=Sphingomonas colocasiae TaxID=1848973 RepID=A0ABS7PSA0_9SPHN|nr:TonB-dependent receptor [Sphingomonas colocasiae]MBY8824151.1 TonB-dependent receptor [Sphingomonas colocasiae]
MAVPAPLQAQAAAQEKSFRLNIAAQPLGGALRQLARETRRQVMFDGKSVAGKRSAAINGHFSAEEALRRMLAGSDLTVTTGSGGIFMVKEKRSAESVENRMAPVREDVAAASDDGLGDSEIVVTAQQREQRSIEVPITINAFGATELKQRGINNLQDLSYSVPEMNVFSAMLGQSQVVLRGISPSGGNLPLVGVYQDEVAVDGPNGQQLDLRPLDVKRVEVLNGPQGTLYGQGSAGGTIRFVTNDPVIGRTSLTTSAELWGTRKGSASGRLTATANLPLNDIAALRVSGVYEKIGGWIDAPTAGRTNINDGRLFEIRIKGLLNLSDDISLVPMIDIHRNRAGSVSNGEDENYNIIFPGFMQDGVQPVSNDFDLYSLTANVRLGGVKLLAVGSIYRNDMDGGFFNRFGALARVFTYANRNRARTGEVRLSSDSSSIWKWTAGIFYRNAEFSAVNTLLQTGSHTGTVGTTVNLPFNTAYDTDSWSFYGNTSYQLSDRLEIGGGLRYFVDSQTSPSVNGRLKADFHSLDPRIYAVYKLAPDWSVYASAAKGFRSGGFNAVNASFPQTFGPEDVWSYEVGTKFSALDRLVSGEISGFISRYSDMQTGVIALSVGLGYTGNVGRAHVKGIDWNFRLAPANWLTLGTTGALVDTRVVESAPASGYQVGDRLSFIPKFNAGAFVETQAPLSDDVRGTFRVDYNRRGDSVLIQRTANLFAGNETLHLLNARLGLSWKGFDIQLFAENILNDRGRTAPNPLFFSTRVVPRSIGIKGAASF